MLPDDWINLVKRASLGYAVTWILSQGLLIRLHCEPFIALPLVTVSYSAIASRRAQRQLS